ncbi:recombination regulator RecX [Streptococcus himalayensis]|uniref:Regulatory protein RecX n=1 Tax=Streptococcus himalayensis TaxID=1888195 RepID=A0A917A5X5_9STRE|nr:recombination regulator RecX [Streptococcus himalayensis]GGE29152.1 regulatory protein RecX [Streptococcus himalayensis]
MKITKIEKKKRLYLLELDQDTKLYITEDTIVRFFLSKGKEINETELEEIQTFAQFSYGKNLALYYLSFKPRTTKEVRTYLCQHEIDEKIIPQILENLTEQNWLNDEQYARSYAESNLRNGNKGAYALRQNLQQKGIEKHLLDRVLEEFDFSNVAEKVAEKLLRKYRTKLPPKSLKDKILQSLMNKGFSYSEAKQAYEELEIEPDQELTMELLYQELDKQYRKYARKYEGYELKQRLTQTLARKGYDFSDISSALREYF